MKKILVFMVMLMVMSFGALAVATPSLVAPASSGTVTGTYTLNSTVAGGGDADLFNVTYYARASNTVNSSYGVIATLTNVNYTTNGNALNITFDSTALEDSSSYDFLVQVENGTDGFANSSASSSVVVDNTNPTAPTSLTSGTQTDRAFTITSTVTGSQTTSCTMTFVGRSALSGNPPAGTHSGNTCTFSITNANEGSYQYTVTASDGTDTATSAQSTIAIKTSSGGKAGRSSSSTTSPVAEKASEGVKQAGNVLTTFFQNLVNWLTSLFN